VTAGRGHAQGHPRLVADRSFQPHITFLLRDRPSWFGFSRSACFAKLLLAGLSPASLLLPRMRSSRQHRTSVVLVELKQWCAILGSKTLTQEKAAARAKIGHKTNSSGKTLFARCDLTPRQ
jgi:hypothetical protein